jgi:hypothetical protein
MTMGYYLAGVSTLFVGVFSVWFAASAVQDIRRGESLTYGAMQILFAAFPLVTLVPIMWMMAAHQPRGF